MVDVHRGKAAFIVMRVPERKLLAGLGYSSGLKSIAIRLPKQLWQPRDVDGDPSPHTARTQSAKSLSWPHC
jgi:hypothetical protein